MARPGSVRLELPVLNQRGAAASESVTWEASTNGALRSTIPRCTGIVAEDKGDTCVSCTALVTSTFLGGVVARASQEDMHLASMSNQYLTATQQQARYQRHVQSESLFRLMVCKGETRVSSLLRRINAHKRIILARRTKSRVCTPFSARSSVTAARQRRFLTPFTRRL